MLFGHEEVLLHLVWLVQHSILMVLLRRKFGGRLALTLVVILLLSEDWLLHFFLLRANLDTRLLLLLHLGSLLDDRASGLQVAR